MEKQTESRLPKVAVVIPTLNSASTLRRCLVSISELSYMGEYEVIIVDGGSKDGTVEVAREFGAAKVLLRPGTSRGGAGNEGVRETQAEIVAFTDGDAEVTSKWLSKIVEEMQADPTLDILGGPDLGLEIDPIVAKTTSVMNLFRRLGEKHGWKAVFRIKGVNSAYRRKAFLESQGFDDTIFFGEESELHARMISAGKKIKYSPDVVVYHRLHTGNLRSLTRAFWTSRLIAPLFFKTWTLRAALHDSSSPLATLLILFVSALVSIPLLLVAALTGRLVTLLTFVGSLTIAAAFAYSLIMVRNVQGERRGVILLTSVIVITLQSILRGYGSLVGAVEYALRGSVRPRTRGVR